jgi:hypothetical protein
MGTYLSSTQGTKRTRITRKTRTYLTTPEMLDALDATISQPNLGLSKIGPQFGLGGSTINGWLFPQFSRGGKLQPVVIRWFEEHGKQFVYVRPNVKLAPELLALSVKEKVVGPLDIGPAPELPVDKPVRHYPSLEFTPQATGDLLVLKTDIDRLLEQAEKAVAELTGTRDSLAVVIAWQGDSKELANAKTRIAELEHQVRLADSKTEVERSKSLSDRLVEVFKK